MESTVNKAEKSSYVDEIMELLTAMPLEYQRLALAMVLEISERKLSDSTENKPVAPGNLIKGAESEDKFDYHSACVLACRFNNAVLRQRCVTRGLIRSGNNFLGRITLAKTRVEYDKNMKELLELVQELEDY